MGTKRLVAKALAALVAVLAGVAAYAVAPVAVWNGDFSRSINGYTLDLNGHDVTDGAITIQDATANPTADGYKGVDVNFATAKTTGITVICKYSDLATGTYDKMLAASCVDSAWSASRAGVRQVTDGTLKGCWYGDNWSNYGDASAGSIAASGYIAFTYKKATGTYLYYSDADTVSFSQSWGNSGLQSSNDDNIYGVTIGGSHTAMNNCTAAFGMKITAIAVFDKVLTTDQMNAYRFPSQANIVKWGLHDVYTWTTPATVTATDCIANDSVGWTEYNLDDGTDGTQYTGGATSTNTAFWHYYCYSSVTGMSEYTAPGRVARFVSGDYRKENIHGKFSPLVFGGILVESGATGYSIQADSGDGTSRSYALGDPKGVAETWLDINEDFTINRADGGVLMGDMNISVASGKTLVLAGGGVTHGKTFTAAQGAIPTRATTGGSLKFHGEGQLAVTTLTATGSTLDYSDLASRTSTDPFVSGTIAVDSATVFKLPSGAELPYRVATSGSEATVKYTIGDGTQQTGELKDGCIRATEYAAAMAASGAFGSLEFTPEIPDGYLPSAVLLVNVTDDATLTFGSATSVGTISFNIADGKTLTIADPANLAASKVVIYGTGSLAFGASPNLGAANIEFAGDATLVLSSGQMLTTTGAVTVGGNASPLLAPAAISATSQALVSAGSVSGEFTLTAPDEDNKYILVQSAGVISLKRAPLAAFAYDAYPGGTGPTGWITQWGTSSYAGDEFSATSFRVGPSGTIPYVYHTSSSAHPWSELAAKTAAFSLAVYADVASMESSKGIIAEFGNNSRGLFLYRDGGYVKMAHVVDSAIDTSAWVPGVEIQAGYHLYTMTYDPTTGAAALYLDDGTESSATDGSTHAHFGTGLNGGFQIGSTYGGTHPTGFSTGADMALCAVRGYDTALNADSVAVVAEMFPATDGTIAWDVEPQPSAAGNTYIVTSATFADDCHLGVTKATMTIPEGATVNVKHFRANNTDENAAATVNIAGTLNITSTSPKDRNVWWATNGSHGNGNEGIMFGHYRGTGVYTITGSLLGADAYLQTVYTAGAQAVNIAGGTVDVKGLYASGNNSTITVTQNGVLEVDEAPGYGKNSSDVRTDSSAIAFSLGYGTYRQKGDGNATAGGTMTFTGTESEPTTLDPYGARMTVAAMAGSGYVTVSDSSDAGNGTVVFPANGLFTGYVILTDANAANVDLSAYDGKVLLKGTTATTLAKLDGFAGTVVINDAGTYDASAVDLSSASVMLNNASATLKTIAGKEGTVTAIAGAVQLYTDNDTFLYNGHVFTGGINTLGGATLTYYHSENAPSGGSLSYAAGDAFTAAELAEVLADNNIIPYFRVFVGDDAGTAGTLSTVAHWQTDDDAAPTSGNVAIRVSDSKTLAITIDNTVSFGEVQVVGAGTVVLQGSGTMTVTKRIYTTSTVNLEIAGGVVFSGDTSGVHVQNGSTATISTGMTLPYAAGYGTVVVATDTTVDFSTVNSLSALTVNGTANFAAASSPVVTTLRVDGTVNVPSTATPSITSVAGAGTVVWDGVAPIGATSGGIWTASAWSGTNFVKNLTTNAQRPIEYWGRSGSFVKLENVKGWLNYNVVINPEVILDNGSSEFALDISDGSGQDGPTYFRKISGAGTLKQTSTTGNQRFVLRDFTEFTGSVAKSDTQRLLIFAATTVQASLPARSGNGGKLYVLDGTAKIGDGKAWTVDTSKMIEISGAVEMLGTATMTGPVTLNDGATLKFDSVGTGAYALTVATSLTVAESSTANIAFADGATLVDGAKLISWPSAPAGSFAFSHGSETLTRDGTTYTLEATSEGLFLKSVSVTLGAAEFAYGADYTNATVSVAVTAANADGAVYTLACNGQTYTTSVLTGGKAVFSNVVVPRNGAYETVSYTVTAAVDGTQVATTGAQSAMVADSSAWFTENATTQTGGAWATAVDWTQAEDGYVTLAGNTYTATEASSTQVATIDVNIAFPAPCTDEVEGTAQGAFTLLESSSVEGAYSFAVLGAGGAWVEAAASGVTPALDTPYAVKLTFDYTARKYSVTVDGAAVSANGSTLFDIQSAATQLQTIEFAGTGKLAELVGTLFEGYMVKDAQGNYFATVAAAIAAWQKANGPYTILHSTDTDALPRGWSVVEGRLVKNLAGWLLLVM